MLIASSAKINLFLEVCAKLPDNYHQVNTVLSSIDLFDYLSLEPNPTGRIELSCNLPELSNQDNLIWKMAHYLKQQYHVPQGISIHLDKHIPLAAGLGGGSSNAANCLMALNELWTLRLSASELNAIAARFGSDINFFLSGGTALGESRGEVITPLPYQQIDHILLVNPHILIPASVAYRLVHIPLPHELRSFNPLDLPGSCFNRLESGIRLAYPAIDIIIVQLQQMGADIAMMSGSGSTCFGVFYDQDKLLSCRDYFQHQGYWTCNTSTTPPSRYMSILPT